MPMHSPAHPGQLLREHMGEKITVSALARHLGMTRANLSMILNGRLGITAATALKLSQAFPVWDAEFWLGLQTYYDLAQARKKKRKPIKPMLAKAG